MSIEGCSDRIEPEKDLLDMDMDELKLALEMVSCGDEGCQECQDWVKRILEAIESYERRQKEFVEKVIAYRRANGIPDDGIVEEE